MLTCRLATSDAWQVKEEESGLASAKHAAASAPLEGLKGAFWVRTPCSACARRSPPCAQDRGVKKCLLLALGSSQGIASAC